MPNVTVKCANCDKGLTKKSPGLECSICAKIVHANATCSGLTAKQLAALRNTDTIGWTCGPCQYNSPNRKSSFIIPEENEEEDEEELSGGISDRYCIDTEKFMKSITTEMEKLLKKALQPIESSLNNCCSKIDDLTKTVDRHNKEIKDLGSKYTNLKSEHTHLQLELKALKKLVQKIDQHRLDTVLELSGLPKLPKENLKDVSSKLSQLLNKSISEITYVKQIDRRHGRDSVVQLGFQQIDQAKMWVRAARKTQMRVENIVSGATLNNAKMRVILRPALTKANKSLLWQAQQKLRPAYKYVWYQDGKVLVRKNEDHKPIVAGSEDDIATLIEEADNTNIN